MATCDEHWRLCADGSVCTPLRNGSAVCFTGGAGSERDECVFNTDCAPGLLCFGTSAEAYCLSACHELDPACGPDQICRTRSSGKGYCRDALGAPCEASADCAGSLGCTTEELDTGEQELFPSGYCALFDCETNSDCPGDSVCRPLGAGDSARRLCLDVCASDADCRFHQGYRCLGAASCEGSDSPESCEARFGPLTLCALPPQ
jgi:hypothetical protein